jgi:pyocin large subunit-like protein
MTSFRSLLFAVIAVSAVGGFVLGGPSLFSAHTTAASDDSNIADTASDSNFPAHTAATTAPDDSRLADTAGNAGSSNNADEGATNWSHGRDGADANADQHWRKHGSEFSEDHTAREYEDEASSFVHHPPPGAEIKHRANGDTLIYDHDSNTFAVENRDGEPRTMFKPDRGKAYWDRQR